MPITHHIDAQSTTVFVTGHGRLSQDELAEAQSAVRTDPAFRPYLAVCSDFRDVERLDVSSNELEQLVAGSPLGKGSRRAIIAGDGPVYDTCRLVEEFARQRPEQTRIFHDEIEARTWLGLPPLRASDPPSWMCDCGCINSLDREVYASSCGSIELCSGCKTESTVRREGGRLVNRLRY